MTNMTRYSPFREMLPCATKWIGSLKTPLVTNKGHVCKRQAILVFPSMSTKISMAIDRGVYTWNSTRRSGHFDHRECIDD